jgi:hypothetical protein
LLLFTPAALRINLSLPSQKATVTTQRIEDEGGRSGSVPSAGQAFLLPIALSLCDGDVAFPHRLLSQEKLYCRLDTPGRIDVGTSQKVPHGEDQNFDIGQLGATRPDNTRCKADVHASSPSRV